MRWTTLRARVVTWYVGLLAATLMLFGTALYLGIGGYLRASLDRTLVGEGAAISSTFVAFERAKGPQWMAGEINEAYDPELTGRFIRISIQGGAVIYASADSRDPEIHAAGVPPPPANPGFSPYRKEKQRGGGTLLIHTLGYTSPGGVAYWVETGASLDPMKHVLWGVLRIVLVLIPLILIGAAVGGTMLMRVPLQPLVTLAERAEQIGTSALGERLPVLSTGDEMERMSLSLNRMITRLEESLGNNRRFSADVSHELRTPLTIMRGELEQVLQDPELPVATRISVNSVVEEIGRLAKIVESLLMIARLDAGADAITAHPVDLSSICHWTVEQLHLLAEEKEIDISLHTEPLPVSGDTSRLKQVFVNLIDNAIKYTPDGGSVRITSLRTERMAVIEIADTGIGIGPENLPYVFERFYRTDKGRARVFGGTGLGLSIVKAICNAHGGAISLRSLEGEGTVVRVELPLLSGNVALSDPARTVHQELTQA